MSYLISGEEERETNYSCEDGIENLSLTINVCHHSASLVMPIGDPRNGFFYPTLTLIMDSFIVTLKYQPKTLS